ncbi:diguanylate cyclase (GGDEF)-like protein [Rhodoblastus acidophilus]|uniref:putative bifunctional diguanylate cyclase/phosphodiesterase n=1 Tax=Rhodoblastus acidophilus TaxID=1074 RepID=UPI002224230D|nr:EAL domain-containing protein [Rhodoblastus acidophilus]MCW2283265.1 diguanylate cyclase (GGDEF)-like protein [Rhodoblastus acidophilus]MCW2332125.1 diguanylate cyclase (GGDEF)-like protein [Rhodoblastus acidophilus]
MSSAPRDLFRQFANHWLLIAAGIFSLSMVVMTYNLYASHVELRDNADARLIAASDARSAAIGDFIRERRQDVARLAGGEAIADYFGNRDLGMSVKYGLFASLAAIEHTFKEVMDKDRLQDQRIYEGLTFFDRDGVPQVKLGAAAPQANPAAEVSEPDIAIDARRRLIMVRAPVIYKDEVRGAVEAVIGLDLLAPLMVSKELWRPREFLLDNDGAVLFPTEPKPASATALDRELASLPAGRILPLSAAEFPELKGYFALRAPVKGADLSILRLASEEELYGRGLSPLTAFCMGLFSVLLFALALGFDLMRKTAARLHEEKIHGLAFYDQITGLPNRCLLIERIREAQAANARHKAFGALMFIDLDNFKTLNDTLGHDMGDLLLTQVAERLKGCVDRGDMVARLGGDEFVVLLGDLGTRNVKIAAMRAEAVGERILRAFSLDYDLKGYDYSCTLSIGVAFLEPENPSIDDLLKRADLAMYDAKAGGRNGLRFFDPFMQTMISAKAALEADLREDMKKADRILLYYQPQVDHQGKLVGAEALVRWVHPQRGMVPPAEFIPVAESAGLILSLGALVLEIACRQLARWAEDPATAHLTIAVNVSAIQMRHKNFAEQVIRILEETGANPHRLKLELTESTLIKNIGDVIAKMEKLKAIGVSFSLDDFGTGFSSLAYLKRLPLDQIKIDISFVQDVLVDANDAAIAQTIIALGHILDLSVVAEGVETEEQYDFLARYGQLSYQGYLFGRPLPAADFERLVAAFSPRRRTSRTIQGAVIARAG